MSEEKEVFHYILDFSEDTFDGKVIGYAFSKEEAIEKAQKLLYQGSHAIKVAKVIACSSGIMVEC